MATTGEQLAAWKQLGGTVRTVKKNKEFIAPGGEKQFFVRRWERGDFEKKETTRRKTTSLNAFSSRPSQAPSPPLIRLESSGDGHGSVESRLTSGEEEECESRRARSEARGLQPSLSSHD